MDLSHVAITRPVGTSLLAIGLLLVGAVAYFALPVASMPNVDFPTIRVNASLSGADPETSAATLAAPLERHLGEIGGLTQITSVSSLGSTSISLQFDLSRNVEDAARDVQGAINAAAADLPAGLPQLPAMRKANTAAAPVLILALTSKTLEPTALYDIADTVLAQRLSQVTGVAEVSVNGAAQPATRITVDPDRAAAMGLGFETIRAAISNTNTLAPIGAVDGENSSLVIATNAQLQKLEDFKSIVVQTGANGTPVLLGDIARIDSAPRSRFSSAEFNRQPAVLLVITKAPDANIIDTVDRVKALLPELKRWIPAGVDITIQTDRSESIRASVGDMQRTLLLSIGLVMLVVFAFLRRVGATAAAGITVPLSLAGTCALMWLCGYSINNLTLMAFAVAVGFVVDDAIVMIENVHRSIEAGVPPLKAAFAGARQIGFTVFSISLSLLAAFVPLLFMGGVFGRFLHEFSMTLVFAIVVSTVVSLTVTPMVCAYAIPAPGGPTGWLDRSVDAVLKPAVTFYGWSLDWALRHRFAMLAVFFATIAATVWLFIATPKGDIPQDDSGLLIISTEASPDVSFAEMSKLQGRVADIMLADPAVANVSSTVGASGFNASLNQGRMFVALKPLAMRGNIATADVIDALRKKLRPVAGITVTLNLSRDIRTGARSSRSQYQYTLWDPDLTELVETLPKAMQAVAGVEGIADVSTDREQGGRQIDLSIDRDAAARMSVPVAQIVGALGDAFAQRQVSLFYSARNQYPVILEIDPAKQRTPSDLARVFVQSSSGNQVPLSSLVTWGNGSAPLVVNHQGSFPAVTITYNLKPGVSLETATRGIEQALARAGMPDGVHAEQAGDARAFADSAQSQQLLIVAALLAVYIVLGVLYESLIHPLTIISTLPSAGLGALLALNLFGMDLTIIGFIGVILLIGIVKKNGIMMVDFALEAERERGLSGEKAIREACLERFRPILMTTLAAVLGAFPMVLAIGAGSELRRPLGVTIVGGLLVSQVLTLYTTPVIYLLLDRLHRRWQPRAIQAAGPAHAASSEGARAEVPGLVP